MLKRAVILILMQSLIAVPSVLAAGVSVSKTNGYAVIGPGPGISVSKTNAYAVLAPPAGISVSKSNAYAILAPARGISISKAIAYAVVKRVQPTVFVITKNENSCFKPAEVQFAWLSML